MPTRIAALTTLLVVLVIAPGARRSGLIAQTQPATAPQQQQQPPQQQPPPQMSMQDMTRLHDQMMEQMKAGDAKLDALVTEMNAAKGEAKIDAVAAVVSELVAQQKTMHGHMGQMHQMMMGGRGMMMMKK